MKGFCYDHHEYVILMLWLTVILFDILFLSFLISQDLPCTLVFLTLHYLVMLSPFLWENHVLCVALLCLMVFQLPVR